MKHVHVVGFAAMLFGFPAVAQTVSGAVTGPAAVESTKAITDAIAKQQAESTAKAQKEQADADAKAKAKADELQEKKDQLKAADKPKP